MNPAVVADLLGSYADHAAELASLGGSRHGRRPAAEELQRALWRHRDQLVGMVVADRERDQLVEDLQTALRPFAMGAAGVPPHNPVLVSIPMRLAGGLTYVQWRSADFRRAAELLGLDV